MKSAAARRPPNVPTASGIAAADPSAWWTVPQASVWIRTRDLATVEAMESPSLAEAALAIPGTLDASACLLAALRTGRLIVRGRLARSPSAIVIRPLPELLDDADRAVPAEFWDGASFNDDPSRTVSAIPADRGESGRWINLAVRANDCIGRWQPPAAILGDGPLSLRQFLERIDAPPLDRPEWLLTHPAVNVTGLNDRAERMTVDRAALARGVLDGGADTVTDGRLCWSAVVVELNAPAWPERSAGAKHNKRDAAMTWLAARLLAVGGWEKNATLLSDMRAEGERTGDDALRLMTDSTMRRAIRALKKAGQNPVK